MRLPALIGETQPVASTSGRLNDSYSCSEPCYNARRHRLPLSTTRRRMPPLYISRSTASAMTKTGHADSKICAATTATTGNQHPGQPAMPKDTTIFESVPEHWLKHVQRVADARSMKGYIQKVAEINALEPSMAYLTDEQLQAKTSKLKLQVQHGKDLDVLLPEAFAVVREASKRVLNMRHYDVQLIGGMALHDGSITEMMTGEGKTLAATLPAYLNALSGKGVHIITVNDYLAKRDGEWMGKIFAFLGLTVGIVQEPDRPKKRRAAFGADITYITSVALGFTYLGDTSIARRMEDLAIERPFSYAIVDEADSVLIDDCLNPLLMSQPTEDDPRELGQRSKLAQQVIDSCAEDGQFLLWEQKANPESGAIEVMGHYVIDTHLQRVSLTHVGMTVVLQRLVRLGHTFEVASREGRLPTLDDLWMDDVPMGLYVLTALRARELFKRDVHYIVRNGEVKIVSINTGRVMPTSRWMDDLHQALEAKEGVDIKGGLQVTNTITFQTLFKYYPKLSGMTGTAISAVDEFHEIYGLLVVQIPPHKPSKRIDHPPRVYLNNQERERHLHNILYESTWAGRPVLIGTASIAQSEELSRLLSRWSAPHQMLNARPQYVRKEAKVIAQAGLPGMITIATNMAGRGVDILMGGEPQGLAQMALEQLVFKPHLSDEDWALGYENVPSYFSEFASRPHMQSRLPPQLLGAISRVQALAAASLPQEVGSSAAQHLLQQATLQAEKVFQGQRFPVCLAEDATDMDDWLIWQHFMPLLDTILPASACSYLQQDTSRALQGREDSMLDLGTELARALACLRLYFALQCRELAEKVKAQGGLLVLVLAIQESKRIERQLQGRAGRQGDPGETRIVVGTDDPLIASTGLDAGTNLVQPLLTKHDALTPYLEKGQARMFIELVRRQVEQGRQGTRASLARSDQTVETFRQNKGQLRLQLLQNCAQDRRQMLRAAIVDFAQWLVHANVDLRHPPCDPEWNLEAIVKQIRYVINPSHEPELLPKSRVMVQLMLKAGQFEVSIPAGPAENVLGPDSEASIAQRLRSALIMRPRQPDFGEVPGMTPNIQADLQLIARLQQKQAKLDGSSFEGRWRGGAEGLVLHIAASMVVAYEKHKEIPSKEAIAKWKACQALVQGQSSGYLQLAESDGEMLKRWERTTMLKVLDNVWAEFLKDIDSVKTAVAGRSFAQLDPHDEFRLEAGALYLKTLRRLRHQWVKQITCGPKLYVDLIPIVMPSHGEAQGKEDALILDIGPPIDNLDEEMIMNGDSKEGPGCNISPNSLMNGAAKGTTARVPPL